jgi:hypothetical protein
VHLLSSRTIQLHSRLGGLLAFCGLYLVAALYQLGLPGLHYDEAKEAGNNALELLTGAPVNAFREGVLEIGGLQLPLMVQDYIGALNVYLALPVLALTGIGVPNLRLVSVFAGLLALFALERVVSTYWQLATLPPKKNRAVGPAPITDVGLVAVALLVLSPSFVFWSRQGIFVTNLMQPLVLICIWQGLVWLQHGSRRALIVSGAAAGLALYAKLLAVWVIVPVALLIALVWWWRRRQDAAAALTWPLLLMAAAALVLPLLPLLLFNWQTGGTWATITGNLTQSYYGVDNRAVWVNLPVRLNQLHQVLQGEHFWYLGGLYGNFVAPWLAATLVSVATVLHLRLLWAPLTLGAGVFFFSLFTVSDLFITHYALIQVLLVGIVAVAALAVMQPLTKRAQNILLVTLLLLWMALDGYATIQYHSALQRSGGLADHSDGSYHLAYHLRYNGLGAPVVLDWGIEASVRYLSQGTVRPIEIFGYESPAMPDEGFKARLELFLANPDNIYLLHAPEQTVFAGRREAFIQAVADQGLQAVQEQVFTQRDGTPLYELWRVLP